MNQDLNNLLILVLVSIAIFLIVQYKKPTQKPSKLISSTCEGCGETIKFFSLKTICESCKWDKAEFEKEELKEKLTKYDK